MMKLFSLVALTLAAASHNVLALDEETQLRRRMQDMGGDAEAGMTMVNGDTNADLDNKFKMRITNIAYQQPFGAFFVMTHNHQVTPLFKLGGNASAALARLAEDGDPSFLVEDYEGDENTGYVGVFNEGAPYFGGQSADIVVPYNAKYPFVTIASMAINTNDCFVAVNGIKMLPGFALHVPGYDSGTEENNELCESIPGPACDEDTGNVASGNGEGFVHVHRGFFGVGPELSQAGYDWRNPMMRVEMYM